MLFNNIKYYHLSYWEKKCAIDQMEKWYGNHQIEWKTGIRNKMKNNLRVKIFEKYNYNLLSKDVIGKYDIRSPIIHFTK